MGASGLDDFTNAFHLVRAQVVHDDHLVGYQVRHQHQADVSAEHGGIHGSFDGHYGANAALGQGTETCHVLAMIIGCSVMKPY